MTQRGAFFWTMVCMLPAVTGAQEVLRPSMAGGAPLRWENSVPTERVPINGRPALDYGNRSFAPARSRPNGLLPRVGVGMEAMSNVYLSAGDAESDRMAWLAPGFNYVGAGSRWNIEADASVEATKYDGQSELDSLDENKTGYLALLLQPGHRTTLTLVDRYLAYSNPTGSLQAAVQPRRSETRQHFAQATLTHGLTRSVELLGSVEASLWRTKDPLADASTTHAASLGTRWAPSPITRLTVNYDAMVFDFDRAATSTWHGPTAELTHQLAERVSFVAAVGTRFSSEGSEAEPVGRMGFQGTSKFGDFDLLAQRELMATGGIGSVLRVTTVQASVSMRVATGLSLELMAENVRFDSLQGLPLEVSVVQPKATLLWTPRAGLAVALRANYLRRTLRETRLPVENEMASVSVSLSL